MVLLDFIILISAVLIIIVSITQVAIPTIQGTQLFPWLRREKSLSSQMEEERQRLREAYMKRDLNEIHKKVEEIEKDANV